MVHKLNTRTRRWVNSLAMLRTCYLKEIPLTWRGEQVQIVDVRPKRKAPYGPWSPTHGRLAGAGWERWETMDQLVRMAVDGSLTLR